MCVSNKLAIKHFIPPFYSIAAPKNPILDKNKYSIIFFLICHVSDMSSFLNKLFLWDKSKNIFY